MTKNERIIECIRKVASAYTALEVAKSDCDDVIDSEIELAVAECSEPITGTDKKNIKRIAKAISGQKVSGLIDEIGSISPIIADMFPGSDGDDE